jgi:hypothetical protein
MILAISGQSRGLQWSFGSKPNSGQSLAWPPWATNVTHTWLHCFWRIWRVVQNLLLFLCDLSWAVSQHYSFAQDCEKTVRMARACVRLGQQPRPSARELVSQAGWQPSPCRRDISFSAWCVLSTAYTMNPWQELRKSNWLVLFCAGQSANDIIQCSDLLCCSKLGILKLLLVSHLKWHFFWHI